MKINVKYNEIHNCLEGKAVGIFEPQHVKEYLMEVIKVARKHKCKRFLNDLREAELKMSITDLYYASAEAIHEEFDRSWKRALLVKEKTKEWEFFEITANNKGLNVKIFTDYEKALTWL